LSTGQGKNFEHRRGEERRGVGESCGLGAGVGKGGESVGRKEE